MASAQTVRDYEVVALQGQATPAVSANARYGILGGSPHVDATGGVTFGGFVMGHPGGNYAVWTGKPGVIDALAVAGDPTPGRDDETLDVLSLSSSSDYWPCSDGSVAFRCRTQDSADDGIWIGTPASLHEGLIVNSGIDAIAGATVKNFPGPEFVANGEGLLLARATLAGGGVSDANDTVVLGGRPEAGLGVVAREGGTAPGLGVPFDDFTFASFSINGKGELCFESGVKSGNLGTNAAIFAGAADALAPVVRKGNAIPILAGFSWDKLGKPRINNRGDIAFEATPKPDGERGFFVRSAEGAFTRIAADGEAAPGAGGRRWDGSFFNQPVIAGEFTAFREGLEEGDGLGRDGIWVTRAGGETSLVAKAGDATPSLAGDRFETFDAPCVNALGTVAFKSRTANGRDTLWFRRDGVLTLVVATGDSLTLRAGDTRRVASITFRGGASSQGGYRSGLNDEGRLAFGAGFDQGGPGTAILLVETGGAPKQRAELLEAAFGSGGLPTLRSAGGAFELVFQRRTDASFSYQVQSTAGLQTWSPFAGQITVAADQADVPAGYQRVSATVPAEGETLQLRVRVEEL